MLSSFAVAAVMVGPLGKEGKEGKEGKVYSLISRWKIKCRGMTLEIILDLQAADAGNIPHIPAFPHCALFPAAGTNPRQRLSCRAVGAQRMASPFGRSSECRRCRITCGETLWPRFFPGPPRTRVAPAPDPKIGPERP
jgi:hypothetical protein